MSKKETKYKIIIFKGVFNPIPDIYRISASEAAILEDWDGGSRLSFYTKNKNKVVYGAGEVRRIILKRK